MPFDFTSALAKASRVVHDTFKVECQYTTPGENPRVVTLYVRLHSRMTLQGNLSDEGYADYIEGVDRVIFDTVELRQKNVFPVRAARIVPVSPHWQGVAFTLDSKEPKSGPVNEAWKVTR